MAYAGQNFDMSVPTRRRPGSGASASADAELMELAERFHDLHQADRGFSFRQQEPTVRGVRITALGRTPKPADAGRARHARAIADARPHRQPPGPLRRRLRRHAPSTTAPLGAGAEVTGPALVEEPFTVVAVPPGARCASATHTSYELTLGRWRPVTIWLTDDEHRSCSPRPRPAAPATTAPPGAGEMGGADYVDQLLGAFASDPPRIWAGGPFSGRGRRRAPASTSGSSSGALDELAWRTRIEGSQGRPEREFNGPVIGWQERYRTGLAAPRRRLRRARRATSRSAACATRSTPTSATCCSSTPAKALYGDPVYGGNRDGRGWTAIAFDGDVQPRGWTDDEVTNAA